LTVAHKAVFRINADHHENGVVDTEHETDDYIVAIGYPDFSAESMGRLLYMVVNKGTGVIEYFDSILPNVVATMRSTQKALDGLAVKH
jgi:hypothetical protein